MANKPRTPEDLERKYNFASLMGLSKNVKMNEKTLNRVNNELANMLNTLIINLKDILNSQGDVSLWFYSGAPTVNNAPYINWSTPADHFGDIYYDQATGYVYQFSSSGWVLNTDTNLIQAMALTNVELDTTTDHERKVYFAQPTPPYSSGDWWILEDGTLKTCQLGRITGDYEAEDFILANKYVPTVASADGDIITIKKGQVIKMSDTFASFEDLATGGKTVIDGANIKTGTINTDNVKIGNDNVTIDKEGMKLKNGAKIIGENGLMNTYIYTNGESFETCGYEGYDPAGASTTEVFRRGLRLIFNIPEGLNITSATLMLFHAPVYWGWYDSDYNSQSSWGYCRNLKLYKASNINDRTYTAGYMSEYFETNDTSYSEISSAFGTDGWTPAEPNSSSHNTEKKISEDIKAHLSSGLNELLIQPGTDITWAITPSEICSKSAFLYAMLKIDGYMSYE